MSSGGALFTSIVTANSGSRSTRRGRCNDAHGGCSLLGVSVCDFDTFAPRESTKAEALPPHSPHLNPGASRLSILNLWVAVAEFDAGLPAPYPSSRFDPPIHLARATETSLKFD